MTRMPRTPTGIINLFDEWFHLLCTPNEAVMNGREHVGPASLVLDYTRISRGFLYKSKMTLDISTLSKLSDDALVVIIADVLQTLREST